MDDTNVREGVKAGDRMPIPDSVPKPFAELITRCWAHDPEKRPSMLEVVAALEPLVGADAAVITTSKPSKTVVFAADFSFVV